MGIDHRGVSQVKDLMDGIYVAYGFPFLKFTNIKTKNSRMHTVDHSKDKKKIKLDDEDGKNISRELF